MCGSALFGKPPKPVQPAQFQDAKSPEYDARSRTLDENKRRGFAATILASRNFQGSLGAPATTASVSKTTLGA
jgi:hypothetical protein